MRILNTILLCLFFYILPANAEDESADLKKYVDALIHDGYGIVQNNNLSDEEKIKRSSILIRNNLHLDWMAKYTLGRHKRGLPSEKMKEFTNVYSKFVINAYADLSRHYNGEKAVVKKVKKIGEDMFIINMEIVKTDSPSPLKIDYLIHKLKNVTEAPYRVADVITEGVSILNSQQSEFDSVISSQGIDALIADLNSKIARKNLKKNR